jgi:hypothetical protein
LPTKFELAVKGDRMGRRVSRLLMAAFGRYCCKSILGHGARNIDSSEAFKREGWFKALSVAERKLRRQSIQPTFATLSARFQSAGRRRLKNKAALTWKRTSVTANFIPGQNLR